MPHLAPGGGPAENGDAGADAQPTIEELLERASLHAVWQGGKVLKELEAAGITPPHEWLMERGDEAFGLRGRNTLFVSSAFDFYARAGAADRLNRLGEYLCLAFDLPDHLALRAFVAAGNVTRAREASAFAMRAGHVAGIDGFRMLEEVPPPDLLIAYADAFVTRCGPTILLMHDLSIRGLSLPRAYLLAAAERYEAAGKGDDAARLRAAADAEE